MSLSTFSQNHNTHSSSSNVRFSLIQTNDNHSDSMELEIDFDSLDLPDPILEEAKRPITFTDFKLSTNSYSIYSS